MTKNTQTVKAQSGRMLRIIVRPVGQSFGCCADVRAGRKLVATTGVFPWGWTQTAIVAAMTLAKEL